MKNSLAFCRSVVAGRAMALTIFAIAPATTAIAAQTGDAFQATVNIQGGCRVVADDLDFGTVGTIRGNEIATATVSVQCTGGIPFSLSFDPVRSTTRFNGRMWNGGRFVTYRAQLSGRIGIGNNTFLIRGSLPRQRTPPAGTYSDIRTIYLNY